MIFKKGTSLYQWEPSGTPKEKQDPECRNNLVKLTDKLPIMKTSLSHTYSQDRKDGSKTEVVAEIEFDTRDHTWVLLKVTAQNINAAGRRTAVVDISDIAHEHLNIEDTLDKVDWLEKWRGKKSENNERRSDINPVFENIFHSFGFPQS